jgi:hypothetical protein
MDELGWIGLDGMDEWMNWVGLDGMGWMDGWMGLDGWMDGIGWMNWVGWYGMDGWARQQADLFIYLFIYLLTDRRTDGIGSDWAGLDCISIY